MKFAIVLLSALALTSAAPKHGKLFHEHCEDFIQLIKDEAGHDLEHLMSHYVEFEEFRNTLSYLQTAGFRNLIHEMESLPEFVAVVNFLENDNIDILYFLDRLEDMLSSAERTKTRHQLSGTDFNAFLKDIKGEFPKEKLNALFQKKLAEDETFEAAISNLYSEEWQQLLKALWESEEFKKEAQNLAEHGIDVDVILTEIKAIMGQD